MTPLSIAPGARGRFFERRVIVKTITRRKSPKLSPAVCYTNLDTDSQNWADLHVFERNFTPAPKKS